jgi:sugar phosphate isomerase/epimerase
MRNEISRREVFGIAAAFAGTASMEAAPADQSPSEGLRLGVCTYSVRNFQRNMAISLMKPLGVSWISVKELHEPYTSTPAEAAKATTEFEAAGFKIASGGTVTLHEDDPRGLKYYFDYAKMCKMPMIVAAPSFAVLPDVEKLAKQYDIKVAIHTHGPEDKYFPAPPVVLDRVKNMDPRMGVCMDVGHSMRAGVDVVEMIDKCGSRLLDMHFKDLKSKTDKDSQCEVGRGVMPVVAIFKQLKKVRYQGCVNLEYEINADNPLPGMLASISYMRGVLAGMAG